MWYDRRITDEGYLIYNCFSFTNKARVAELEPIVENLRESNSDFCDAIERISTEAGGDQMQCCVNSSNGKMRCERKSQLDLIGGPAGWFSFTDEKICDRCSTGTAGDLNSCDTYDTDYPNNFCKND